MTGYRAKNINIFRQMKTSRKVHICFCIALLYPTETAMQGNANSLPISHNFHVVLLLVNVMFPSELCQ